MPNYQIIQINETNYELNWNFSVSFLGFVISLRTKNIENHKLYSNFEFLLLNYFKSVL